MKRGRISGHGQNDPIAQAGQFNGFWGIKFISDPISIGFIFI
jgi:hypothetical protein